MKNILHLSYHYVCDTETPGVSCSPERLAARIKTLQADNYEILTCGEVAKRKAEGRPLPEKHATLSFDDGLKDHSATAFPILKKCGVPATFFCTSSPFDGKIPAVIGFQILIGILGPERLEHEVLPEVFHGTPYLDLLDPKRYDIADRKIGEPERMRRIKWMFNHWPSQSFKQEKVDEMFARYVGDGSQERYAREWFMSADEIRMMAGAGMEIASHTVTHPALDVTGLGEMEGEFAESKRRLSEITGSAIETFAWTFGGIYRPAAKNLAAKYYSSAWNLSLADVIPNDPYADLFDIPRMLEHVL